MGWWGVKNELLECLNLPAIDTPPHTQRESNPNIIVQKIIKPQRKGVKEEKNREELQKPQKISNKIVVSTYLKSN